MIRLPATESGVRQAASLVGQGQVVLWPSGGVYGLATSAWSAEGINRIYAAKGRAGDKPLQVLATAANAGELGMVEPIVQTILDEMWPDFIGFVVRRIARQLRRIAGPGDTLLLVCSNWVAGLLSAAAGADQATLFSWSAPTGLQVCCRLRPVCPLLQHPRTRREPGRLWLRNRQPNSLRGAPRP